MSSRILALDEYTTLTVTQKTCLGFASLLVAGWWVGVIPFVISLLGFLMAGILGGGRWRGEWIGELAVRAIRFHSRSRFSAVTTSWNGDDMSISCRGVRTFSMWTSDHRGRLDLAETEREVWASALKQMDSAAYRDETSALSVHAKGHTLTVATEGFTLSSPWVRLTRDDVAELPAWIFESWVDVQSNRGFHRVFDVRDFRQCRQNPFDVFCDGEERWALHGHFVAEAHSRAVRRTRRDRHSVDAAMSWRRLAGRSATATLLDHRSVRQHHEERVADGAALVGFRLCIVVTADSLEDLKLVSSELLQVARRAGVVLRVRRGEQGRALAASWPGISPW